MSDDTPKVERREGYEPEQYHKISNTTGHMATNGIECYRDDDGLLEANSCMFRMLVASRDKDMANFMANILSMFIKQFGEEIHKECDKLVKSRIEQQARGETPPEVLGGLQNPSDGPQLHIPPAI